MEVSCDRHSHPHSGKNQIQCPVDCHACCASTTVLDLTAVEALLVYLLNRDMVHLVERHTQLQGESGYCPYLIADKCIIHTYKPTACQMFMPFEYKGKPMCFYLADNKDAFKEEMIFEEELNSNCYAIHGFMVHLQNEIIAYLSVPYFKNTYAGTLWWHTHYSCLPENTRFCLESILEKNHVGQQLIIDFGFSAALSTGEKTYLDLWEKGHNSSRLKQKG